MGRGRGCGSGGNDAQGYCTDGWTDTEEGEDSVLAIATCGAQDGEAHHTARWF